MPDITFVHDGMLVYVEAPEQVVHSVYAAKKSYLDDKSLSKYDKAVSKDVLFRELKSYTDAKDALLNDLNYQVLFGKWIASLEMAAEFEAELGDLIKALKESK